MHLIDYTMTGADIDYILDNIMAFEVIIIVLILIAILVSFSQYLILDKKLSELEKKIDEKTNELKEIKRYE